VSTIAAAPAKLKFSCSVCPGPGTIAFPTTHYISAFVTIGIIVYADFPSGVTYAVTDTFGNAVAPSSFTISAGTLTAAGGFLLGSPSTASCTIGTTCGAYGAVPDYSQAAAFGTTGAITGSITATYTPTGTTFSVSQNTGFIKTTTFDTASVTPIVYGSSLTAVPTGCGTTPAPTCIPAGKSFTVRSKLTNTQTGVPVTLYALTSGAVTQTGTFSNGAKSITVSTNGTGVAVATFSADTVATHAVNFIANASKPTDTNIANALGASAATSVFTTVPGAASTLIVTLYYDSLQMSSVKTAVVAGASYHVRVSLSDAFGNSVTVAGTSQLQITLTASQGVLSATTVYIASGASNTFTPPSFGDIVLTLPSALVVGSTVAVTASGAVGGAAVTGSKTVTLVSPLPTFAILSPKSAAGVLYSNSLTVIFSGQANASVGYASSVTVKSVGFKIGTSPWQSAAIAPANKVVWSIAATFPAGLNTILFNATDSSSPANVFVSASTSLLIDTSPPTIAFTTAAGATLTTGTPLAATITDTLGDLNATSVTASRNGTAIPASSITVTGTNNPGSSVTYSVSITGLPSGKWTVTLKASDLAGNAATAATITVTAVVLTNQTFTATSATQSVQSGFTGVSATWASNAPTSQTVNLWFVAYNAKNQVVFASFTQLTFAAGGSATLFQGLSSSLPSGTYTVQVFVVSTTGTALSASTPVVVSF